MKFLLIFLMLMANSEINQPSDLSVVRGLYQNAAEQETAAKKLLEITREYNAQKPVLLGYKGAGHMMMAKHVINPFSKMSHFNKGKKIYASAIAAAPQNLELRFLRFSVQAEAPGFLGYKQNIEEDKQLLLKGIGEIEDPQLQKMILQYLLNSGEISSIEKEKIKQNTH